MTSVFALAVDAIFRDGNIARAGLYRAGGTGAGVPVRVVLGQPDEELTWHETRLVTGSVHLRVRISEIADLRAGDRFEIDGRGYEVIGMARRDDRHLAWTAEARPV